MQKDIPIDAGAIRAERNPIMNVLFGKLLNRETEAEVSKLKGAQKRFTQATRDAEEDYRRITSKNPTRDLSPIKQSRMIKICDYLVKRNPLAKRYVDILKGFIIGKGSKAVAKNEKSQEVIDEFRKRNRWKLIESKRTRELGVFGELLLPVWVKAQTGRSDMGYIDPDNIDDIKCHPMNTDLITDVILKRKIDGEKIALPVVNEQTKENEENYGLLVGDQAKVGGTDPVGAFYFRVNDLSDAKRGLSDLLCGADWFDALDTLIFNIVDREGYLNSFIYDVTIKGANDIQLELRRQAIKRNPPKSGAVMVHNEEETWQQITPALSGRDATKAAELVMMMIVASTGMPEHWMGKGGEVNRATALEMGAPTLKMIGERQEFIKEAFTRIHTFALDQAIIAGHKLRPSNEEEREEMREVEIILPELSEEDAHSVTLALLQLTNSLGAAISTGLIELDQAAKVYAKQVSKLGVKVEPPTDESIKAKADSMDNIAKATQQLNDAAKQAASDALASVEKPKATA